MKSKILSFSVVFVFVILISVLGFLAYKLYKKDMTDKNLTPSISENYVNDKENPIQRYALPNGGGVMYEVIGSFVGEVTKENVLMKGNFMIKDDPLQRTIPVYMGAIDGTILFGKYEKAFVNSSWERSDLQDIADTLTEKEIIITVEFGYPEESGNEYVMQKINFVDNLIAEFISGEFKLAVPSNFALSTNKLGVVGL